MAERERLMQYVSVVPNAVQKNIQEMGFYVFIHYGMNTFTGKEWGDGTTQPQKFSPLSQDTDQWAAAVKSAGAKGIILTAKHHDGFCLWQTDTTEYSIKNSPYKGGKGDVVAELSESCKKFGLKLGIYLSPWDRNAPCYGTEGYDDFYVSQLTELLTRYGELFCVWLDGACGAHMDGKSRQVYDFERYYSVVRELQPNCAISNCGPDVRWVGNEGGFARKSEWNVVPEFSFDLQNIAANSQQEDDQGFRNKGADVVAEDLGSRDFLKNFDSFMWYPAEVDVSIRPGWFFHAKENRKVRSLNNLLYIYYTSVGGNSLLLLNIPPDRRGLLHENDVNRLKEVGNELKKAFEKPVKIAKVSAPDAKPGFSVDALCGKDSKISYSPMAEGQEYVIELRFERPISIDKVRIKEDCEYSQRIEEFKIFSLSDGRLLYNGTTVGYNRIALFKKLVTCSGIKIVITSCRLEPYIRSVECFESGGLLPTPPPFSSLKAKVHALFYKIYIWREDRKNKKK